MKRALIITARAYDKEVDEIRKNVIKQMQEGVVVLPYGCLYSVEEVEEVRVETPEKMNKISCHGCEYRESAVWEFPCSKCKRSAVDLWKAKGAEK